MNPLIDEYGRPVPLGQQVGSGGEGGVYLVPGDPSLVAKVYHQPPSGEQVEKLTALRAIGTPKLEAVCAWPRGLLRDASTRQVVGFTMPRLANEQPLQHLYNPVMRLRHYPRCGWRFQVAAARNVAAVFDDIHRAGCLVGDVNQSNAFVNNGTALVRLIDCDSFQVRANGRAYPCEVGTPHYTPPELQGWPLRGLVRTENHDRFGLAVLIYQLLFVGRHPYAGVYQGQDDPSFEELIAQYRFAQGPRAATWDMAPPPHTPTFADIPPDVGDLFRRAFERGSENGTRPTATEWMSALDRLAGQVTTCRADAGHAYWGGASGCVWCRLARNGGPEYYYGVAGGAGTFAVDEGRLQEVLRRLAAIAPLDLPSPPAFPPMPCQPRPVSPELLQLVAALRAAREQAERELAARREAAAEELKTIDEQERRRKVAKRREYREQLDKWDDEMAQLREAVAQTARSRRAYKMALACGCGGGCLLLPFGLLSPTVAVIGALIAVVFGVWLLVHWLGTRSSADRRALRVARVGRARLDEWLANAEGKVESNAEARRGDVTRRTAALERESESVVDRARRAAGKRLGAVSAEREDALRAVRRQRDGLVNQWAEVCRIHRLTHQDASTRLPQMVTACRALATAFAVDHQVLAVNARSSARVRHLRLYALSDENAVIPLIGTRRRAILAANGVLSAADISDERVLRIPGFGQVLTRHLLTWREGVLREFRFDPSRHVATTELAALAESYRDRQMRLLRDIGRLLGDLESAASQCRATLASLEPQLRQVSRLRDQAEADVRHVTTISPW